MDNEKVEVNEQTTLPLGDEVKNQIITEYLKSLLSQAPKVNLGTFGAEVSSPKSKPKTFAEAAKYTVEKLKNKE